MFSKRYIDCAFIQFDMCIARERERERENESERGY